MTFLLPLIGVIAGFTLAASMWCIFGNIRARHLAFLPFGVLAMLVGMDLAALGAYYSFHTLGSLSAVYGVRFILSCFIFPAAIWFIGVYTRLRDARVWALSCAAIFASFAAAYLLSDGLLFFSEVRLINFIGLFGQSIITLYGLPGPLFIYFTVAVYMVFSWAFWRCFVLWRGGLWYKATPLSLYLLLQLLASLVDDFYRPPVPLEQFTFMGLVVIMGASLFIETRRLDEMLYHTVGALQTETTKRKHYEARLRYLATHDPLTDLANRRELGSILDSALQQYQASGELGAIVLLDLDHFKTINDSLGHQTGDKLLRMIAERLRTALPGTRCVSRLGGDEFVIVLGNLGGDRVQAEATAMQAADVLRAKLGEPFALNDRPLSVGGSVGVTLFPNAEHDEKINVGALLRQADLALYRAKASGRNRAALFATKMQQDARLRLVIEEGLRSVLNRDELELYFQPQKDFQNQLIGAEVLLRWNHPRYGVIEPNQFIPVAEEAGLIHDIGEFVLENACRYLRDWNETTSATLPRLAINVSPWQLVTPEFARKAKRIVVRTGIDPRWLTLEITENAVLQDIAEVTRTILELSSLGVRFAIDDFGSGYAALASLKKLPLQELKIDRMFVSEMRMDIPDQFIRTIISMAEGLGLYVIAEGVETEAQRMALRLLGCPGFQGYLISRPLRLPELMKWLVKTSARQYPKPPTQVSTG